MPATPLIDYSETAERYVLAYASLGSRQTAETLEAGLRAEDFYVSARRLLFAEMAAQSLSKGGFDMVSVCNALEAAGTLENVGGRSGIVDVFTELYAGSPLIRPELLADHVRSVTAAASRRRAVVECSAALERLRAADSAGAQALVDAAAPVLGDFCRRRVLHFSHFAATAMQELEAEMKAGTHITGIRSGFFRLDSFTSGFKPGKLYIIAARPGMGKTTFALDAVRNILSQPTHPAPYITFVSAEMEGSELFRTMLAADSQTDLRTLSTPEGQVKLPAVTAAARRLSSPDLRLDVIEAWNDTIDDIALLLRARRSAGCLDLAIVDYLQLIPATGDRAALSTVDAVAEVSHKLQRLAVSLHIPVIALAQINRDASGRPPTLKDLKGSGAIEQDADVVILLDRPELALPPDAPQCARDALAGITVLDVAKNRSGASGRLLLDFAPAIRRFSHRPDQNLPATR